MRLKGINRAHAVIIWAAVSLIIIIPITASLKSPLLSWRDPIYILAGFAGVIAMVLLLIQPLLAGEALPGFSGRRWRTLHRSVGSLLVLAIIIHVAGLWITSPPDVIDALTFASPTPFSIWGVIAMWAIFATALLAIFRRRLRLRPRVWRSAHTGLAVVIVLGSSIHAMLIVGTMETLSKAALCLIVCLATARLIAHQQGWLRKEP